MGTGGDDSRNFPCLIANEIQFSQNSFVALFSLSSNQHTFVYLGTRSSYIRDSPALSSLGSIREAHFRGKQVISVHAANAIAELCKRSPGNTETRACFAQGIMGGFLDIALKEQFDTVPKK